MLVNFSERARHADANDHAWLAEHELGSVAVGRVFEGLDQRRRPNATPRTIRMSIPSPNDGMFLLEFGMQ